MEFLRLQVCRAALVKGDAWTSRRVGAVESLGRGRALAVEAHPARLSDDERRGEAMVAPRVLVLVVDSVQ
jgi:hypothetical protein